MEKLIELLKDQYGEVVTYNIQSDGGYMFHICGFAVREERLLSKKFGFIKWLVQENKINFNKDALVSLASELGCTAYDEKIVLMVLSISDTPIDLLCSLLK